MSRWKGNKQYFKSGLGEKNIFISENSKFLIHRYTHSMYKRAQRALGRSPEENVKGHSGANNREPQGHNLNNFGRGPLDDVIY